jgi:excisionase family DNA binding protein
LLTMEQAAELLNVTPRMIRRLIAERRIGYVKVGRYVRLRPKHIEEYLSANDHPASRGGRHR